MDYIIISVLFIAIGLGAHRIYLLAISRSLREDEYEKDVLENVRKASSVVRMASGILFVVWTVYQSILIVSVGQVGIATLFGTVQERTYNQGGPYLVNPFAYFSSTSVRRKIVEFQVNSDQSGGNNEDVIAVSSDNLPLTIDVTYAYQINPRAAWVLYRNIGDEQIIDDELIVQVARSATRSATTRFDYVQATTTNRDALALAMQEDFEARLIADLVAQGIPEEAAKSAFTVLPVQLRKVLPPDRVQLSIAEKIASEQDLQRQVILTNIARQEAERRGQEGVGVNNLFTNLPRGFTPLQISQVMTALANKERADAQMKAVESGKVTVMVMDGGGNPSVNVSGQP